ncbi:MAG: hypothetical protein KAU20_00035 [Nanoarchaeota archaeon]|nr:hypothetical protein [Nanoarchaeota archaeon]
MFGNHSEEELDEKPVIRKKVLSKLRTLKRKKFDDESILKFSWVFRVFFMKLFHINYEFTYAELEKEITKQKISKELEEKIIGLSQKIISIEYREEKLSKEEFRETIGKLEEIIDLTIPTSSLKPKITPEQMRSMKLRKKAVEKRKEKDKQKKPFRIITIIFAILFFSLFIIYLKLNLAYTANINSYIGTIKKMALSLLIDWRFYFVLSIITIFLFLVGLVKKIQKQRKKFRKTKVIKEKISTDKIMQKKREAKELAERIKQCKAYKIGLIKLDPVKFKKKIECYSKYIKACDERIRQNKKEIKELSAQAQKKIKKKIKKQKRRIKKIKK